VALSRDLCDEQPLGDLLVLEPIGDESENLALSLS
jgi:hypothetical protein